VSGDDLRALLATSTVTHVPGIHDPISAALAVRAGHRAVHLSGAAVSALALGRPDLNFGYATQVADRATTMVPALEGVPLIADGDTGFSDPLYAVWTALSYVRAGISGLHLEDRAEPERWGQPAGKELIAAGLAAAKISALAREVPQLAVIARTDAYGLAETIDRGHRYAEAGADAFLPAGISHVDHLAEVHAALPRVPLVIVRTEARGGHPPVPDADLAALGVRLVLHPLSALLAALRAVSVTYRNILDTGTAEPVDRLPWPLFTDLVAPHDPADPTTRLET
jgi:2-methylisocitrate lyase-like PEP mutase family enzyme